VGKLPRLRNLQEGLKMNDKITGTPAMELTPKEMKLLEWTTEAPKADLSFHIVFVSAIILCLLMVVAFLGYSAVVYGFDITKLPYVLLILAIAGQVVIVFQHQIINQRYRNIISYLLSHPTQPSTPQDSHVAAQ
jgi:hypothetical protein